MVDYIATLPKELSRHGLVLEQQALAISEGGDPAAAAAQLETLIEHDGETPERLGLLGGRYRRLWATATKPAEKRRYLNLAIERYQRGMTLDLNEYYCSSNLPRLYRSRGEPGDSKLADDAELATALACRARLELGTADEWVRQTLLGNAFDRGDVAEAIHLRSVVEQEGAAAWKLASTLDALRASAQSQDEVVRGALTAVLEAMEQLVHGSP